MKRQSISSRASDGCATNPRHTCDHSVYEEYMEAEGPGRPRKRRIIAICCGCAAVATRKWYEPVLGIDFGWLWAEQEAAHRAWKRRQRGGRS